MEIVKMKPVNNIKDWEDLANGTNSYLFQYL